MADHYTQALTLRHATGEPTDAIEPRALAALTEAADQAAATYAHTAAARLYEAALTLTPPSDAQNQAVLLLGHANAVFNAGTASPEILKTAIDAQVAVEAWEAAAQTERMLGRWYHEIGSSRAEADAYLARAAEHAARVAPSDTMCMIAYEQAFGMTVAGQAEEALALVNHMIPRAEQAGLDVGGALLLVWRGLARVTLGDMDGVPDLRTAAETLAQHAHPRTIHAYSNLGEVLRGLGDMSATDAAYTTAAQWASRFAVPLYTDWITSERAVQAYHAGQWSIAENLATQPMSDSAIIDSSVWTVRGRLRLARADTDHALRDATALITYAEGASNDDMFYYGLSLQARCHHAQAHTSDALEACDRFLTRWHQTGGYTTRAPELCELGLILAPAGRHDILRRAALLLPPACRWRDALVLTAEAKYADAAGVYEDIGSQPLAADTHLLAAQQAAYDGHTAQTVEHAQAVLAFSQRTGATLYQHQAEQLATASA